MSADQKFCQSCGMPVDDPAIQGTNQDQSLNPEYCIYCYKDGAYTSDMTLDQMIAMCVPHTVQAHPEMTAEKAEAMMREYMPQLKRWK
ncbi:MAG: zinc ribbon domain-containing protein [Planctomycetes bacterium]|nr:zinc ribbon domain-containing protein [Planctomycetota bacterium]